MTTHDLWHATSSHAWRAALDRYDEVIAAQGVKRLPELDAWFRHELPASIAARRPPHVTYAELVRLTEWKMARGVWRARNLVLVKGNDAQQVETVSAAALARIPDPVAPVRDLAELAGVGPATASAVAAAAAPEHYPFFDELVAAQVPQLPDVTFSLGYYAKYATALRERAAQLGDGWTPATVEQALWANSGGKIALKKR